MKQLTVAIDGSGDFTSIQAALDSIRVHMEEPATLFIKKGTYRERVIIPDNKPYIRFVGESLTETVLSYGLHARNLGPDGAELGTFRTSTMEVHADDFYAENMTIENTAGVGEGIGQALALYTAGDRIVLNLVRLLGYQDTLYTSRGRQYYKDCYIAGHVDFLFGSATCVFDRCEIHSLRSGYLTAASTYENEPYGYIFLDCRLTGSADDHSVYLGRPWRPFAHTAFIRTWMGAHIKPEGWHNWRDSKNEETARYEEFGSTGPGARIEERVGWAKKLTEEEAVQYTPDRIFSGWNPGIL